MTYLKPQATHLLLGPTFIMPKYFVRFFIYCISIMCMPEPEQSNAPDLFVYSLVQQPSSLYSLLRNPFASNSNLWKTKGRRR